MKNFLFAMLVSGCGVEFTCNTHQKCSSGHQEIDASATPHKVEQPSAPLYTSEYARGILKVKMTYSHGEINQAQSTNEYTSELEQNADLVVVSQDGFDLSSALIYTPDNDTLKFEAPPGGLYDVKIKYQSDCTQYGPQAGICMIRAPTTAKVVFQIYNMLNELKVTRTLCVKFEGATEHPKTVWRVVHNETGFWLFNDMRGYEAVLILDNQACP